MLNVIMIDLEMFKEDTKENLIRFRNFMDSHKICRPPQSQMHLYCPFTNPDPDEDDLKNGGYHTNHYLGDGITCISPYSGYIDDPYAEHIWALRWGWAPGLLIGLGGQCGFSGIPEIYTGPSKCRSRRAVLPNIYDISSGRQDIRTKLTPELCREMLKNWKDEIWLKRFGDYSISLRFDLATEDKRREEFWLGRTTDDLQGNVSHFGFGKYFKKIWIQPETGFVVAYEWGFCNPAEETDKFIDEYSRSKSVAEFYKSGSKYVITDQYTAYLLSLPAVKVPEIEEEQELSFERGDLDKVLDKISAKGIESLTQKEKDFLQACTKGFFGKLF